MCYTFYKERDPKSQHRFRSALVYREQGGKMHMEIRIGQSMHLKRQKLGFHIEREKLPTNIFLHFINPVSLVHKGKMIRVSANCCYIGTEGTYIYYNAEHISMLHNFVHFEIDDIGYIERLGLPLNTPFYTDLQDDITDTVEKMEWSKGAQNSVILPPAESLFDDLMHRLAIERNTTVLSGYAQDHTFDNLRTQIYVNPGEWNVEKMAEYVHLSRSHFSIKYKELFGVTPNADINTAALLVACRMLTTTDLGVNKISSAVGYARSDYFIRLFKQKYGMTPAEYRKTNSLHTAEQE